MVFSLWRGGEGGIIKTMWMVDVLVWSSTVDTSLSFGFRCFVRSWMGRQVGLLRASFLLPKYARVAVSGKSGDIPMEEAGL